MSNSKMAASETTIPSLSEYQCRICLEILIEPVTLPCDHTLCMPCFRSTIQMSTLCCPFCRRNISWWAFYHARRNTLVNQTLWELIQTHYPRECQLRASGQESGDIENTSTPVRVLSAPGELRREYEEARSRAEAEHLAQQEEENRESEDYILALLTQEEEEEKRRREREEQLKREELARKRILEDPCEGSSTAFLPNPTGSEPAAPQPPKKRKTKQKHLEDTPVSSKMGLQFPQQGETFPKASSDEEEPEVSFIQQLKNLEKMYFERHKQEQEDRKFALKLQKQLDKERLTPNRQKGSPDAYMLRSASLTPRHLGEEREEEFPR